jgi:hypothetical protein
MTADEQHSIACILSGEAQQDRRAWIAALVRDALRGSERDDLTLRLRFAPEAVQRIQDMVRKEQACCSFLTFEMEEGHRSSPISWPGDPCDSRRRPLN